MRKVVFTLPGLFLLLLLAAPLFGGEPAKPNIVLIFADDLGYGDLHCYGSKTPTPNLDRLAAEGIRFTQFYAAQPVCSASRAALMTGCYPNRVGILGALGPKSKIGLNTNEVTIPRLLKAQGYATAIYGKWHLGDAPQFLPGNHGFDDYFGLPYSNDMWPHHPASTNYPPLPLIEGNRVVQLMPDQTRLTTWYTEHAVKFIAQHRAQPFFLYVPHNMPHVPLHVSEKFKGRSPMGLYGDVIMEIDWSVGEILKALKEHQLEERTLVVFTSDNGPWLLYGNHAGSAGPLREGKATTFEGGVREPCIMRWPGKIQAGAVCREMATTMDLLPTFARLAGGQLSADRRIDGVDLGPLLWGPAGGKPPRETFFYYWGRHLQAVRSGKWKLHLAHSYPKPVPPGADAKPGKYQIQQIGIALYDLEKDPGETTDLAQQHPDVVKALEALAEQARDDLGDSATRQKGRNVRPAGQLSAVKP